MTGPTGNERRIKKQCMALLLWTVHETIENPLCRCLRLFLKFVSVEENDLTADVLKQFQTSWAFSRETIPWLLHGVEMIEMNLSQAWQSRAFLVLVSLGLGSMLGIYCNNESWSCFFSNLEFQCAWFSFSGATLFSWLCEWSWSKDRNSIYRRKQIDSVEFSTCMMRHICLTHDHTCCCSCLVQGLDPLVAARVPLTELQPHHEDLVDRGKSEGAQGCEDYH